MSGNLEGFKLLKRSSSGAYSNFEYEPDASDRTLQLETGLIFLMAFWSGPAFMGFRRVCEGLKDLHLPQGFRFRVLDIDGAANVLEELSQQGIVIGGNAEGYWFKNRQIIATTVAHTTTPERIKEIVDAMGNS